MVGNLLQFALYLAVSIAPTNSYCMYGNCPAGVLRYNCGDFTANLVTALRHEGFDAFPVCGSYRSGQHYWVGINMNGTVVYIEPQNGKLVRPYGVSEIWGYIQEHGEYPEYRFAKRCAVRGIA